MNWYNNFIKIKQKVKHLLDSDIKYYLKLKKIFLVSNLNKIKFFKKNHN